MFKEFPDVLDVKQTAHALQLSKNTVYKLIREQKLPCKRIGRKILIPKIYLIDFVQSERYSVTM